MQACDDAGTSGNDGESESPAGGRQAATTVDAIDRAPRQSHDGARRTDETVNATDATARRAPRAMRHRSPANWCSARVLDAALRVHRALGPGLLESTYRACLAHELLQMGFAVRQEVAVPLKYGGLSLETGYRLDLLVGELVVVEIKAVSALRPVHSAQLLTYLRLANYPLGMMFNFHSIRLMESYVRMVNNL